MAKVVGISGAQGGGKSSLLEELVVRGWQVDTFKVSRAVQQKLGWESLSRVLDSPSTMMEFQREVWRQKFERDSQLKEQPHSIIFTERTFADICAYSVHWGWIFADRREWSEMDAIDWANEISNLCFTAQKLYSGVVLVPFMHDVIKWVDDAHRADRASIERIYESVERFTQSRSCLGIQTLTISTASVGDRAAQVELFTNRL